MGMEEVLIVSFAGSSSIVRSENTDSACRRAAEIFQATNLEQLGFLLIFYPFHSTSPPPQKSASWSDKYLKSPATHEWRWLCK